MLPPLDCALVVACGHPAAHSGGFAALGEAMLPGFLEHGSVKERRKHPPSLSYGGTSGLRTPRQPDSQVPEMA